MSIWKELEFKKETENIGYRAEDLSEMLALIRKTANSINGVNLENREKLCEINRLCTLGIAKVLPDLMLSNYKQFTIVNKSIDTGDENV